MNPTTDLRHLRVRLGPAFTARPEHPVPVRPALACPDITPRQLEVLRLVADGLENKQIADRLGIVDRTVECHVAALVAAFGAGNRTGMAVKAVRMGVV